MVLFNVDYFSAITFYSRVTIEALGLVAQAPELGLETLGLQLHRLVQCLFPGLGNSKGNPVPH